VHPSAAPAQAAIARFGKIDVVVNNAGYGLMGAIEELDAPELEDVFKTNFFGVRFAGALSPKNRIPARDDLRPLYVTGHGLVVGKTG